MNTEAKKYFDMQPTLQRSILEKIRDIIVRVSPTATECMSYGVPAFRLNKNTVMYAAFKEHVGIYPGPDVIEAFKSKLHDYETSKGTTKFPVYKPIPYDLIEKIIRHRYQILT